MSSGTVQEKAGPGGAEWSRGMGLGAFAGVVWGVVSLVVNAAAGVFPFESGLLHNLAAFVMAGAVFGVITGSLLALAEERLPLRGALPKAVFVSTTLWLALRLGGALLSMMEPGRYRPEIAETLQGFFLAVVMGLILGLVWKKRGGVLGRGG